MTAMMKAVVVRQGEPLAFESIPLPEPGAGQLRIRVAAAGLNRADIMQRAGMYPPPAGAPDTMGLEVSGLVDVVGPGVTGFSPGDEVCALLPSGGYAEYAIADAGSVMPIPAGVSLVEAAALPETVMTVWANVFDMAGLKPGETFLVQGGASGIGTTAIQMARALGARVFATAGSDEKCARCVELGAEAAFNYRTQDFETEMEAVGGADVILDMVAGDYVGKHLKVMRHRGRLVHIAIQGGMKAEVNILAIMSKQLVVTGSTLRGRDNAEKARIAAAVVRDIWPWVEEGKVRPVIDATFAMSHAEDAHKRLTSGDHVGKILLTL